MLWFSDSREGGRILISSDLLFKVPSSSFSNWFVQQVSLAKERHSREPEFSEFLRNVHNRAEEKTFMKEHLDKILAIATSEDQSFFHRTVVFDAYSTYLLLTLCASFMKYSSLLPCNLISSL
jgi:hypothetical protein